MTRLVFVLCVSIEISFRTQQRMTKYFHRKKGHCSLCHKYSSTLRSDTKVEFYCHACIKHGVARSVAIDSLLDLAISEANQPSSPTRPIHSRRSRLDRWRCIVYHLHGIKKKRIQTHLHTTYRTINRWINEHKVSENDELKEKQRRGRKRKLSDEGVDDVVNYAKKTKFCTPASIKFHFGLNVSKRTIDRRLIEHGLFGRVGNHYDHCCVSCIVIRVDGVCTLCSTTNALQHRPEETTVVRAGLPQLRLQQCHLL
jgi:transposase